MADDQAAPPPTSSPRLARSSWSDWSTSPTPRHQRRPLVSNLSAIPLFLGYFWMLWEPRRRTWHDIVADSLVVRTTFHPPGEFGRPAR
jgi:hypothetical protein